MKKRNINKKKINFFRLLKPIFIIIFIISLFYSFYKIYKSNLIKAELIGLIEKFSQQYSYTLQKTDIDGLINVPKKEIEDYFLNYYEKSIFLIPIKNIAEKLVKNKWIEFVNIKNNYKNTITIQIKELVPVGIYFDGNKKLYFDRKGEIIDFVQDNNFHYKNLPIFKGDNALKNSISLRESVPEFFKGKIEGVNFLNNRRWNIELKNGIILKLPEKNITESLNNYVKIFESISNEEIEEIEFIDLRLSNKAIFKFKNSNYD